MTFGIVPEYAETGYGYIERETDALSLSNVAEGEFYRVKNFVEKPDRLTAEKYISSGNFFGIAVCLCLKQRLI